MRLLFMGTPAFAVPALQALLDSEHEVMAVYTQPPRPAHRGQKETKSPVHVLAEQHGISVHTPTSLKSGEAQAAFAVYGADAAIVAAYGLLLPKPILDAPRFGCINVHPSRLPRWRGAAPIQRTIIAGDTETSICIMQMEEGLDTGPVLWKEDYAIPPGTTAGALHDQLAEAAGPLILRTLKALAAGTAEPRPQSSEGITYAKKITKEEALIDWRLPAREIVQWINGLNPFPGAYCLHHGERIKIWRAEALAGSTSAAPGTFLKSHGLSVASGDGLLHPLELQREGKKAMQLEEFLKGFSF